MEYKYHFDAPCSLHDGRVRALEKDGREDVYKRQALKGEGSMVAAQAAMQAAGKAAGEMCIRDSKIPGHVPLKMGKHMLCRAHRPGRSGRQAQIPQSAGHGGFVLHLSLIHI